MSRGRPSWKDEDGQDLFAKDIGKGFYENGLCWTVESALGKHPRNRRAVVRGLTDISYRARKSSFLREARKEKRRLHQWEKHLLAMDRKLWKKVRDAEKLAFKEE